MQRCTSSRFDRDLAGVLDGGMAEIMKDDICAAAGITRAQSVSSCVENETIASSNTNTNTPRSTTDAKTKMEKLLIMSKQKGMTAKKIFEFFDANADGRITFEESPLSPASGGNAVEFRDTVPRAIISRPTHLASLSSPTTR